MVLMYCVSLEWWQSEGVFQVFFFSNFITNAGRRRKRSRKRKRTRREKMRISMGKLWLTSVLCQNVFWTRFLFSFLLWFLFEYQTYFIISLKFYLKFNNGTYSIISRSQKSFTKIYVITKQNYNLKSKFRFIFNVRNEIK